MRIKLAPSLASVPDLGEHEVTASQLATNGMDGESGIYQSDHIGRTIALRFQGALLAGPLKQVTDSLTPGLLILRIGDYITAAVPYTHRVTVAPDGYRLNFVASPAQDAGN